MKSLISGSLLLVICIIIFNGCSDSSNPSNPNNPNPTVSLIKIDSAYAPGSKAIVALYCDNDSLMTGYNRIYTAIYDSVTGALLTDAHVSYTPMMDMGSMMHSGPKEDPGETLIDGKWFSGAAVFIMPGSSTIPWSMQVHVHNHAALGMNEGTAVFNDLIVHNNPTKFKSIQTADNTRLYLSYIEPSAPVVGINPFEFTVHKSVDMMNYPADSSYTTTMYPWMPSMGHGSPNNVDPSHNGAGHFEGQVNFTMTGDWQIKVYLEKNGVRDSTYFDLIF